MTGAPVNGGILGIELVTGSLRRHPRRTIRRRHPQRRWGNDTIDPRGAPTTRRRHRARHGDVRHRQRTAERQPGQRPHRARDERGPDLRFEVVVGSPLGDRLTGTSSADELRGRAGTTPSRAKAATTSRRRRGRRRSSRRRRRRRLRGANDPVTSSGEHGDLVSYQGDTLDQGATHLEVVLYTSPDQQPALRVGRRRGLLTGVESVCGSRTARTPSRHRRGPTLIGGDGIDRMSGRGGNDLMYAASAAPTPSTATTRGQSPEIFGDDYLDGGAPNGPGDPDRVHGNGGNDTCTGAIDDGDGDHLVGARPSLRSRARTPGRRDAQRPSTRDHEGGEGGAQHGDHQQPRQRHHPQPHRRGPSTESSSARGRRPTPVRRPAPAHPDESGLIRRDYAWPRPCP